MRFAVRIAHGPFVFRKISLAPAGVQPGLGLAGDESQSGEGQDMPWILQTPSGAENSVLRTWNPPVERALGTQGPAIKEMRRGVSFGFLRAFQSPRAHPPYSCLCFETQQECGEGPFFHPSYGRCLGGLAS
jgi:hypothetical protein